MFKLKSIFVLASILLTTLLSQAQHVCGTSHETQNAMQDEGPVNRVTSRNTTQYVPLRIHLATNTNGDGLPVVSKVLDQMTRLNADFESTGLRFYLAGPGFFNVIKNDLINNNPSSNVADVVEYKNSSMANVFVAKETRPAEGSGRILGYYSGLGSDHVVILNSELGGNNNTLSHEMGHFFNLRHTFFGWEVDPYSSARHGNPLTSRLAPNYGAAVELVNKSNCSSASDQICDTGPDYNFGFGANACNYNQIVRDPNGDTVKVERDNQMGYFIGCSKYIFSPGQTERMQNSYFGSSRNYLNKTYVPNVTPITASVIISSPTLGATVSTYNFVEVKWNAVPNASQYLIEISDGRTYSYQIVTQNNLILRDLEASKLYTFKVRPFNEGFTDTKTTTAIFRTGNLLSDVLDVTENEVSLSLNQNPVSISNNAFELEVNSKVAHEAKIIMTSTDGKLVYAKQELIASGNHSVQIDLKGFTTGVYILTLYSKYGSAAKRVVLVP